MKQGKSLSVWLHDYGMIPKAIFVSILFIWLGGLNIFQAAFSDSGEGRLDEFLYHPLNLKAEQLDGWTKRRNLAMAESNIIVKRAKASPNYGLRNYFSDMNELLDLEDKYQFNLTNGTLSQLNKLHSLVLLKKRVELDERDVFISKVRLRFEERHGIKASGEPIDWLAILQWLVITYMKIAGFWVLFYVVRFKEDKHYQKLSLKDELLICPERFFLRSILWPKWCLAYPFHEDTAEAIRFIRLKAEYLKYKPLGYQLSKEEDYRLRAEARQPIKNFDDIIRKIYGLETPRVARNALAMAYLSLFLGTILQPAIVLAAKHSEKVKGYFYSQCQIVQLSQEDEIRVDNKGSPDENSYKNIWAIVRETVLPELIATEEKMSLPGKKKPKEIFFSIDHVPLLSCLFGFMATSINR